MMKAKVGWLLVILVAITGCGKHANNIQPTTEDLAFSIMTLEHQTLELQLQIGWLKSHLHKCLKELEKQKGLESMSFDVSQAMGFPKIKSEPNRPTMYSATAEPFYTAYKAPKMSEIKSKDWTDSRRLQAFLNIRITSLTQFIIVTEKYIEHLEERLKRLEEHLDK